MIIYFVRQVSTATLGEDSMFFTPRGKNAKVKESQFMLQHSGDV